MIMNPRNSIVVYTDGGARGNPGPAGIGVVIVDADGKTLKKLSRFLGRQTNNWAEYEAVIIGLAELKKMFGRERLKNTRVEVNLDSELVARQLQGEYQIKEPTLFPQFIKVHNLRVTDFPNIVFNPVPRGENAEADRLANKAMDKAV